MEASQTPGEGQAPEVPAPEGQPGEGQAPGAPAPDAPPAPEVPEPEAPADAPPAPEADPVAPDSEDRSPAHDQSPVASDAQEAIIGDPGVRDESQPVQSEGAPTNVDQPHRTSAPPPEAQSGVPLPEDREPGEEAEVHE